MKDKLLKFALYFFILPGIVYGIGATSRSIYTELISTKKANQDITITPTGTGDVVLKDYTGFINWASGVPTEQASIVLTSDVSGILPIANGGTGNTATTKGDIYVYNGSTLLRVGVGTNGQVLTADSAEASGVKYATPGGAVSFTTVTKSSDVTLATTGEDNVVCDSTGADRTLTLPAASGNNGLTYKLTNLVDANKCTIDANASETIGGELTVVMQSKDDWIIIYSDGTNWQYAADGVIYAARYTSDSGQSIGTSGTIEYEDLDYDTHSAYNTGTGEYIVVIDGKYQINTRFLSGSTSWTAGNNVSIEVKVNGTIVESGFEGLDATIGGELKGAQTSGVVTLSKDDVVRVDTVTSTSTSLITTGHRNAFSISRIK